MDARPLESVRDVLAMRLAWLRARRRGIAIWSSVWLAVLVVFISQNVVRDISFLQRVRWWNAALFEALYWLPFIVATPLFAYMASRYEIGENDKARKILIHALVASAFALLQPLAAGLFNNVAAEFLFAPGDSRIAQIADTGRHAYAALVLTALWKYAVIVAVCMAVGYYRSTQDALLRSAELERQLASAQLSALKMQLHPHFLFNALHSAAMLTVVDSRRAHEVLVQLSDLLRATLDTSQVLENAAQDRAGISRPVPRDRAHSIRGSARCAFPDRRGYREVARAELDPAAAGRERAPSWSRAQARERIAPDSQPCRRRCAGD